MVTVVFPGWPAAAAQERSEPQWLARLGAATWGARLIHEHAAELRRRRADRDVGWAGRTGWTPLVVWAMQTGVCRVCFMVTRLCPDG